MTDVMKESSGEVESCSKKFRLHSFVTALAFEL